jgi:hypothetical protein
MPKHDDIFISENAFDRICVNCGSIFVSPDLPENARHLPVDELAEKYLKPGHLRRNEECHPT